MELKKYQKNVIQDLSRYLELLLEKQTAGAAYTALWNRPLHGCRIPRRVFGGRDGRQKKELLRSATKSHRTARAKQQPLHAY